MFLFFFYSKGLCFKTFFSFRFFMGCFEGFCLGFLGLQIPSKVVLIGFTGITLVQLGGFTLRLSEF